MQVEAHSGSELGTLLAAVAKMSRIVQHVGSTGVIGSSAVRKHIEVRHSWERGALGFRTWETVIRGGEIQFGCLHKITPSMPGLKIWALLQKEP